VNVHILLYWSILEFFNYSTLSRKFAIKRHEDITTVQARHWYCTLRSVTYLYFPGRILKYICLTAERLMAAVRPVSTTKSPSSVPTGCSSTTLYVSVSGLTSSKLLVNLEPINIISRLRISSILPLYRIHIRRTSNVELRRSSKLHAASRQLHVIVCYQNKPTFWLVIQSTISETNSWPLTTDRWQRAKWPLTSVWRRRSADWLIGTVLSRSVRRRAVSSARLSYRPRRLHHTVTVCRSLVTRCTAACMPFL